MRLLEALGAFLLSIRELSEGLGNGICVSEVPRAGQGKDPREI